MRQLVERHDFVYEEGAKYVTHLDRPVDAIFQSFDRRVRNHIRSGLRKGQVVIEEVSKREQLRAFYAVLCQSAQAKTFALAEYALFEAIFDLLYPKGMVKFMVARVGDTLAAAYVKLLYKGTIYSWYGGMDRAYRSHRPNELLIWHVLQWGAENGYQLYDFGGSGMQDEGVDLSGFKRKFGGATIPFGRHTYAHFPFALQFSQWGYGAYRQLLGAAAKIRPGTSS